MCAFYPIDGLFIVIFDVHHLFLCSDNSNEVVFVFSFLFFLSLSLSLNLIYVGGKHYIFNTYSSEVRDVSPECIFDCQMIQSFFMSCQCFSFIYSP